MIKQITLQNLRSNKKIELTKDEGQYIIDTIDWGVPQVQPISYRVPFQIGETLSGVTTGTRSISLVGYVIPDYGINLNLGMKWEEYYKELEQTIEQAKQKLNDIINVLDDVLIQVEEYEIKVRPSETIKYSVQENENNEVLCLFTIDFVAYSPMFVKKDKTSIDMSSVEGAFKFPLIIPQNKGVIMGIRKKAVNIGIENNSDVPTGCNIYITFTSPYSGDIAIKNVNTQEFTGIVGLEAGRNDVLEIITDIGNEDIILHTVSESHSVISKLMNGSTFLQIERGKNYYTYDTGTSIIDADIRIDFNEVYSNFKEM